MSLQKEPYFTVLIDEAGMTMTVEGPVTSDEQTVRRAKELSDKHGTTFRCSKVHEASEKTAVAQAKLELPGYELKEVADRNALKLIRILVEKGCTMTEPMSNAQIQQWAVEAGIERSLPAIISAGKKGWLDNTGCRAGTTKLTRAGWDNGNA